MTLPSKARRPSSRRKSWTDARSCVLDVLDANASAEPIMCSRINARYAQLQALSAKLPALVEATASVVAYFYSELEKLNAVQLAVVTNVGRVARASEHIDHVSTIVIFDELRLELMASFLKSLEDLSHLGTAAARQRRSNLTAHAKGILMAWLLAHTDNPRPDPETKVRLAAECDIAIDRLSNWFINARVRILPRILAGEEKGGAKARRRKKGRPVAAVAVAVAVAVPSTGGESKRRTRDARPTATAHKVFI